MAERLTTIEFEAAPTNVIRPRARRMSREFLAVGTPLTPELERLHDRDTKRRPAPWAEDVEAAKELALRIRRSHERSQAWLMGIVCVLIAAMLGGGVAFAVVKAIKELMGGGW